MAVEKRSIDERILELQEKQKQLKEQEKKLKSQLTQAERKVRTKRLIEIGAIAENVLGKPILKEDLLNFKEFLELQEQRGNWFSKAMFSEKEDK